MPKAKSEAGKWLEASGAKLRADKQPPQGKFSKKASCKHRRTARSKNLGQAIHAQEVIRDFVEGARHHVGNDCLFVPGAQCGVPAKVKWMDQTIAASRYMCLLTHGRPNSDGMIARHVCGNGHLSCVNPKHIIWGDYGDNQSDARRHFNAGDNVQDRIHAIS